MWPMWVCIEAWRSMDTPIFLHSIYLCFGQMASHIQYSRVKMWLDSISCDDIIKYSLSLYPSLGGLGHPRLDRFYSPLHVQDGNLSFLRSKTNMDLRVICKEVILCAQRGSIYCKQGWNKHRYLRRPTCRVQVTRCCYADTMDTLCLTLTWPY